MPVTLGIATAGIGGIQSLIGGIKGRKARRELENLPTPQYEKSRSITDFYNQALNRYQQSPTQSNLYKMQAQQIARGTAQGLSSLQDRRSALAGVPALIQGQNDAYLKAAAAAEQDQNQKFSQLGAASQAMAAEDRQAFNINKMLPFQRKSDILGQKAAGYTQLMNAGLQNIYGGLTGAMMGASSMKDQLAGVSSGGGNSGYDQGRYLPPKPFTMQTVPY
jgi:hypothetical protein